MNKKRKEVTGNCRASAEEIRHLYSNQEVKKRQSKLPMTEVYLRESLSKLNIKNKNPYRNCPEKDEQIDKNKNEKK